MKGIEPFEAIYRFYNYSNFANGLLIWMFESKARAQKRALRIVYNDYGRSLEKFLDIIAGTAIHKKTCKSLNHVN